MKIGVVLAVLLGLIAAIYLIWFIGFGAVFSAIATAGFGGLAILCAYALGVFVVLVAAWIVLLPRAGRPAFSGFYLARMVRDSIAEISPFSPVGGMVAAARMMVLRRMPIAYASASVAADATTEAMAQIVFLALGLYLGLEQFRNLPSADLLTKIMIIALLLAIPGIAALIFLQKRGSGFAQRIAVRFFPEATKDTASFGEAVHTLYESHTRLAASAALHLLAWIASGVGTWIGFRLVGGHIDVLSAIALEALLATVRSITVFVPAAIGVQEASYATLAPLFGLPAEMGLAVSLLKRAREIVIGVPALLLWQGIEGRHALNGVGDG
jgi:putative membrane protein